MYNGEGWMRIISGVYVYMYAHVYIYVKETGRHGCGNC
jgi:hypothetical protein